MTATNVCSNFGGFRFPDYDEIIGGKGEGGGGGGNVKQHISPPSPPVLDRPCHVHGTTQSWGETGQQQ